MSVSIWKESKGQKNIFALPSSFWGIKMATSPQRAQGIFHPIVAMWLKIGKAHGIRLVLLISDPHVFCRLSDFLAALSIGFGITLIHDARTAYHVVTSCPPNSAPLTLRLLIPGFSLLLCSYANFVGCTQWGLCHFPPCRSRSHRNLEKFVRFLSVAIF